MKTNKRNLTTNELIAKKFNVKPNYVKCILKIGRVKPINFERIKKGRMAVYVAYSDALAEERGAQPNVPAVKPVMYFDPNTGTISDRSTNVADEIQLAVNSAQDDQEKNSAVEHTVNSTQDDLKSDVLQRLELGIIRFKCPGGCQHEFIINHKTLTYEQV